MQPKQVTIKGKIIFVNDPPKAPLPDPSTLIVKLKNCMRADAPSPVICVTNIDAHKEYKEGQPLTFQMVVPNFLIGFPYDMSAVLNVGWRPDPSSNEWFRVGDYCNDTRHGLCITDSSKDEENFNIKVVHSS